MDSFVQFDGNLLVGIQHALHTDWLTPIMQMITLIGEEGYFLIVLCVVLMLFKRTRRLGIICSLSLLFTFIWCNIIIKPAVDRTRPYYVVEGLVRLMEPVNDASFPSGHSANSMAVAWALFLVTRPVKTDAGRSYDMVPCLGWKGSGVDPRKAHKFGIAAVVIALLIGISRLYLGMHFPSDVLCGLLLGMICATVIFYVVRRCETERGFEFGGIQKSDASE